MTTKTQNDDKNATSAYEPTSEKPAAKRRSNSGTGPRQKLSLLWIGCAATILAIFDHAYLLNEHYTLRFGETSSKSICNINEFLSCAAASASKYSELFGVPMALWGIAANIVLALLILWYPFTEEPSKPGARRNLLFVSGFIAITSLVMGSISLFLVSHLCPFCMIAYLLSFITFACVWFALPRSSSAAPDVGVVAKQFVPVLVLAALAFVGVFMADDQIKNSFGARDLRPLIQESVQSWQTNPQLSITPVAALVLGASGDKAKMVITEFADFRCSHCKQAAPVLKAFVEANPDVQLQFQAWPLDGECNSSIPSANGASCMLARAVNCAEIASKKGWSAHEWVYENQDRFVSTDAVKGALADIAKAAGADPTALTTCVNSPEAKQLIENEARVGSQLNLSGTPSVFVNGKKLPAGQFLPVLQEVHRLVNQ